MSASKPNKSDQREDEVTLASSPGMERAKTFIADDDTTSHGDTTTHERRRHLVKPIILGMPKQNPEERARVRTLRSAHPPKKRSRLIWAAIGACLVGGGVTAWYTSQSRTRPRPQSAAPSATQTAAPATSPEGPRKLRLTLDVRVEPAGARVELDGKPLEKTEGVDIELPCPRGFHELRVEAKDHAPLVKRIPCEGRVLMDLSLDDR